MADGFKILQYDKSERLNKSGSNWTFWKTRIVPYLKGSRLWPYVSGTMPRPRATETNKLIRWEEVDTQALSTILMNIAPNAKVGFVFSSVKTAWHSLVSRYAKPDPITQILAHAKIHAKRF